MLLFGPRDQDEVEVAWTIVQASWRWAVTGQTGSPEVEAPVVASLGAVEA